MKRIEADTKIEEMTADELSRLPVGSVYQVEFTRECGKTRIGINGNLYIADHWSRFLVEHRGKVE